MLKLRSSFDYFDLIELSQNWKENLSLDEWKIVAEFEALLNITAYATTISQSEKKFVGGYGVLVKQFVLDELRKESLLVFEVAASKDNVIGKHKGAKRVPKSVTDWSDIGKRARYRAILEGERRWAGNTSEDLSGADVVWSDEDRLAAFLDVRTLPAIPASEKKATLQLVSKKYVELCMPVVEDQVSTTRPIASDDDMVDALLSDDDEDRPLETQRKIYRQQAKKCIKAWLAHAKHINWRQLNDSYPEEMGSPSDALKLIDAPITDIYRQLDRDHNFGKLPLMARQYIGALMSESFCERCFSAANLVINSHATRISMGVARIKVISRINRLLISELKLGTQLVKEPQGTDDETHESGKTKDLTQVRKRYGDDFFDF
jgi:hypothetical protein